MTYAVLNFSGQDHYYDPQCNQDLPQLQQQSTHRTYGHKRRDSDTLRSMSALGSPTIVEPSRAGVSPSGLGLGRSSPPGARVGRVSPSGKVSPPTMKGRISPASTKAGRVSPPTARGRASPAPASALVTHRRSPTAPETVPREGPLPERAPLAKTWAASDREDDYGYQNGSEREREREGRRIQQHPHLEQKQQQYMRLVPAQPVPVAAAPTPAPQRHMTVCSVHLTSV